MLDEKALESMTPEQKANMLEGLSGALDFITLMQYTNAINDMVNSGDDFQAIKNRHIYYIKDNLGDDELNKLSDMQNNHGFARDCFVELSYIIGDRFDEFVNGKNLINQMINMGSGEAAYNKVMEIITGRAHVNQMISKGLYRSQEQYMEKFVKPGFATIDSMLSKQVLDMIQTLRSTLNQSPAPIRCADEVRGIYEYCQDTDYDYYFSACTPEHIDGGSFTGFKEKYEGFEKTENTDAFIEAVLKLLPKIYLSSENLVSMHSDPAKAQAIYDEALANRPSTRPSTPLLTKDPLPGTSYAANQYILNYNSASKPESVNNSNVTPQANDSVSSADSDLNGLFMEITDNFSISGRGEVFCGPLTDSVSVGDIIDILDVNQQILEENVPVTGINWEHKMWQKAEAGISIGLLVRMKNPKLADDALYLRKKSTSAEPLQASATANAEYSPPVRQKSRRSKAVAIILALFLGVVGAHNFYAGRYGKGLLYLFTAGVWYIGVIVDIVNLIRGTFVDGDGCYL